MRLSEAYLVLLILLFSAAHQQYVAERNANFARINKELIFSGKDLGFEGISIHAIIFAGR